MPVCSIAAPGVVLFDKSLFVDVVALRVDPIVSWATLPCSSWMQEYQQQCLSAGLQLREDLECRDSRAFATLVDEACCKSLAVRKKARCVCEYFVIGNMVHSLFSIVSITVVYSLLFVHQQVVCDRSP